MYQQQQQLPILRVKHHTDHQVNCVYRSHTKSKNEISNLDSSTEQAFDWLEWNYLWMVLEQFKLGPAPIKPSPFLVRSSCTENGNSLFE